jgi:hypothetical protein
MFSAADDINHSMHSAISGTAAFGFAAIFTAARDAREARQAVQVACAQAATSARLDVVRGALQQTIDENHALQEELDGFEELARRQADQISAMKAEVAELRADLKVISRSLITRAGA